ncbi:hypothetical protein Tco_1577209 [Tanacetum coccineum]
MTNLSSDRDVISITGSTTPNFDLVLVSQGENMRLENATEDSKPGIDPKRTHISSRLMLSALTPSYLYFSSLQMFPEVYMHQFWDTVYKHTRSTDSNIDKRRDLKSLWKSSEISFQDLPSSTGSKLLMLTSYYEEIVSFLRNWSTWENQLLNDVVKSEQTSPGETRSGMHTSKDDYLINTLRFISAKEATQIYGAILPKLLTSPEMKETKDYKTYLGFSTGATPPKIVRKFKKASPSKKDLNLSLVPVDEEPKSAKKKVPSKKTTRKQTSRVVIRDTKVESSSKRKEKVYVARGKGIELLSEVALIEDTQYEEVRQKSLRDFHKTHLSGSGTVTKTAPSATKIKPSVIDEGTGTKPGVPNVTEEESTKSEAESWGNDEDDSNNDHDSRSEGSDQEKDSGDDEEEVKDEFVKTLSNDTDDEDETTIKDKAEGDEDEEMDYTTSQLYDDVDIRLNKPVQANDETVQKEGTNAEMTNVQQGNENPEISQVIEDAHVTLFTVPQKTEFQLPALLTYLTWQLNS